MTELFKEFQEFRKILCICPCCGDLSRVSDLRLKAKTPVVKTWLDDYEKLSLDLDKKEERFGAREAKLREIAKERGRKEAEKVFKQAISPTFGALKLDPFDIKPILNPVDFIVFNGMNKKESISDIILLSKTCNFPMLSSIRGQIEKLISKNQYEWQVARIDEKGSILFE